MATAVRTSLDGSLQVSSAALLSHPLTPHLCALGAGTWVSYPLSSSQGLAGPWLKEGLCCNPGAPGTSPTGTPGHTPGKKAHSRQYPPCDQLLSIVTAGDEGRPRNPEKEVEWSKEKQERV